MSKQKRKALFGPGPYKPIPDNEKSPEVSQSDAASLDSEFSHKILRSELFGVFLVTLGILVMFGVLMITNNSSNWIEGFSAKIMKLLVRDF